ncbi:myrosinase 1-like isoform X2 [Anthonomus grandis grandis]|uniref:myrosinase 1-like isoform X2 n=1 Tax=Anthonomus grandis grandis TaxID=2921223 RepID=UPI002166A5B9|nr:myrosinase 1-like isoform X2 [Anthonomus grandis grandis]
MHCIFLVYCLLIAQLEAKCKKCFPPDFIWGVSSSAYQVEGAWNTSGKGENIWDWYTHTYPEKIADGNNGDIATDSYGKWREDVELVRDLGVGFYRFSLSWARILPDGTTGYVNQAGVDYYLNIIKALKEHHIEPLVTIYHWDLPLTLLHQGGWLNKTMADRFAEYATLCFELFGPYVKHWVTVNEPYIHCYNAYGTGLHAPGVNESGTATYKCLYTCALAHAKAYRVYQGRFKEQQNGQVGPVLACSWFAPLTNSTEDVLTAENALLWDLGLVADPLVHGNWPQTTIDRIGNLSSLQGFNSSRLPEFSDKEKLLMKGSYDFLALNYYTTDIVTPIPNVSSIELTTISYDIDKNFSPSYDPKWPQAASPWLRSNPIGLRNTLNWLKDRYGGPRIFITENGWSEKQGILNDTARVDYIKGHLCNVLRASRMDNVNVIGYFYWSLLNSYEWTAGYTELFGLVEVDFQNPDRTRTPKESYYYYKNVAETNCLDYCPFR